MPPLITLDHLRPRKPRVGLLAMALLEDRFNRTGHMRGAALSAQQRYVEALTAAGAQVVSPTLVESPSGAVQANAELRAAAPDLLVCLQLAYTQGSVVLVAVRGLDAPLLVWNGQQESALPASGDFDFLMTNLGSAGVAEMTNALLRAGRAFSMLTGPLDSERLPAQLREHVVAAAAAARVRHARIGVLGHEYEYMTDLQVERHRLISELGPIPVPVELGEVGEAAETVKADTARALAAEIASRHRVQGVDAQMLERVARTTLALKGVAERHQLDALASFEQGVLDDPRIGIVPSLAESFLVAAGLPVTAEADVTTAAGMLLLQEVAGHCTFLESFFMEFALDRVFLLHDGVGNPDLAEPSTLVIKPGIYYRGVHGMGPAAEYSYRPGAVTLASLAPGAGGAWQLVVAEGEAEELQPRPLAAPQMLWRYEGGSVGEFFDRYCLAGGIHHQAACYGRQAGVLEKAARYLPVGFTRI